MFFKVIQYGYETFQNFAPIVNSVICSEMNTASLSNKKQKLRPRSCKVRNNMETTLHVNEFKFHKPGIWRNNKNCLED